MFLPEWIVQEYSFVIAPYFLEKFHSLVNIGVGEQCELFDGVLPLQAKLFGDKSLERVSKICFQHLDVTGDMLVKFINFFGRDPEFLMLSFANGMLFKLTDIFILHLELGDIPCKPGILGIPAGSGLTRIVKLKDRVKDRLLRQTRREGFHAAIIDQHQFLQTNGTIKNHVLNLATFAYNTTRLPKVCDCGQKETASLIPTYHREWDLRSLRVGRVGPSRIEPNREGIQSIDKGKGKYCIIHRMEEKIARQIVQKCKEVLSRYYGLRLKGVILYG